MAERKTISQAALAGPAIKPRIRVQAGSAGRPAHEQSKAWLQKPGANGPELTVDSFQNFAASLGIGTNNQSSASYYGFNPISRNHTLLEWMYRGSWVCGAIVDCIPDDMTRAGVDYKTDMEPEQLDEMDKYIVDLGLWHKINLALKWAGLYGGAGCYIAIKGQRPDTPLRIETIGKGQFEGLITLDRWMIWPHLQDLVTDAGPDFGKPKYYDVVADGMALPRMRIHYSRFIRFEGVELPYWQALTENLWGISKLEPLFDRLTAFDSATTGAAQLVYKAHLRTYSVENLRELIANGGIMYNAFLSQMRMVRQFQNSEGLTLLDSKDKFETHAYQFGGLSDMLIQFAQQLSGGARIPLTRLFGQSPAGLNATGDADIRNYYDHVNSQQNNRLKVPWSKVLECISYSLTGKPLPPNFGFKFKHLWQMSEPEKATVTGTVVDSLVKASESLGVSDQIILKELKQLSEVTGVFTNITDEDIKQADSEPPPKPDLSQGLSMGAGQQDDPGNEPAQKPATKPQASA